MSQPSEDDVIQTGQGNKLIDLRCPAFGSLSETDRAHLRQRTDGTGQTSTNGHHTGNGGRADGAEADKEHTEFAARRGDLNW
jgi:hypothetical protein